MTSALLSLLILAQAPAETEFQKDLAYRRGVERCRLDVALPKGQKGFATIIWFHGGGLTGGEKEVPRWLLGQGVAVVAPNYRLTPGVPVKTCIEDAAAATAWVVENVSRWGGDPKKIFVTGHSAGGYLASMIVLDRQWLKPYGVNPDTFAGLVPFSGQAITHMAARKEKGIPDTQPLVDELAPLWHVRKDSPPTLILSGDRNLELLGRYEESAYFWRMMKIAGHPNVQLLEFQGYDHGEMPLAGFPVLLRFVREQSARVDGKS